MTETICGAENDTSLYDFEAKVFIPSELQLRSDSFTAFDYYDKGINNFFTETDYYLFERPIRVVTVKLKPLCSSNPKTAINPSYKDYQADLIIISFTDFELDADEAQCLFFTEDGFFNLVPHLVMKA